VSEYQHYEFLAIDRPLDDVSPHLEEPQAAGLERPQ